MASYVVMEPQAASDVTAVDRAVLVRDRFSLIAFILPVVWLLWHRLWVEAIFVLAISIAFAALGNSLGLGLVGGAVSLLVSLFIGLEGPALRIAALRRRGWREWGAVEAANMSEAEIRYLAVDEPSAAVPSRAPAAVERLSSTVPVRAGPTGPALGMLGYPGRH